MSYLSLGPVPAEESCAQVGETNYVSKATRECRRHVSLLRQQFGPEPEGIRYKVMSNHHEFGDYLDVVVSYDPQVPGALEYAFRVEREAPRRWIE